MSDENRIRYVPGMPWRLVDGVRLPDLDAIRACPFPTPYTASQLGARPVLACPPDSSETSQEFKDECDINIIMKRYAKTGRLPTLGGPGVYGDFSEVGDYLEAYNFVAHAQEVFSDLPANLRERFRHDPGQLLAFVNDANNRDEAIKLGLIAPTTAPASPPANEANQNDQTNKPA